MIKKCIGHRVNYPSFFPILLKIEFSRQFLQKFLNIRPMGVRLFHDDRRTDGRTDMTKLIVAFRNFANAPKMY